MNFDSSGLIPCKVSGVFDCKVSVQHIFLSCTENIFLFEFYPKTSMCSWRDPGLDWGATGYALLIDSCSHNEVNEIYKHTILLVMTSRFKELTLNATNELTSYWIGLHCSVQLCEHSKVLTQYSTTYRLKSLRSSLCCHTLSSLCWMVTVLVQYVFLI